MESDLTAICHGVKAKEIVVAEGVRLFRAAFDCVSANLSVIIAALQQHIQSGLRPDDLAPLPRHRHMHSSSDEDHDGGGGGGGGLPPAKPRARGAKKDAPPRKRRSKTQTDGREGDKAGPACAKCAQPSVRKMASREGPNNGRWYYCCRAACGFIEWADAGGANKAGRVAGSVAGPSAWVQPAPPLEDPSVGHPSRSNPPREESLLCNCNKVAAQRVAKKAGPNQGRPFYCCAAPAGSQCDFFLFSDTAARAVDRQAASGSGVERQPYLRDSKAPSGASALHCFSCGQAGHFVSNCPKASQAGDARGRGRGRAGT